MKKILILCLVTFHYLNMTGQTPGDYLMKAKALMDAGRYDEAAGILTPVAENLGISALYLARAEAYLAGGNLSPAISDFNSSSRIEPASGEYGLARIYSLRGDAATAVYHLEASMKSDHKRSEKEIMLDPSFAAIENTQEWRQFWRKDWYSTLEKGIADINYSVSTGKTGEARQKLAGLSGAYRGNDLISYTEALIYIAENKNTEAIRVLSAIGGEYPRKDEYFRLLAKAQEASGNFAGASESYSTLIDMNTGDPELYMLRAGCYRRTGEILKAIGDVEAYLSLYPGSKKALSFAGRTEAAAGDNLKALAYFSENVKLHPHDADCYVDRANSYFAAKSWEWAINDFCMSLDLQPGNPEAWLNKGIALLNSGKREDACHDFRVSFNLGNKKATEYLSRYCIR